MFTAGTFPSTSRSSRSAGLPMNRSFASVGDTNWDSACKAEKWLPEWYPTPTSTSRSCSGRRIGES